MKKTRLLFFIVLAASCADNSNDKPKENYSSGTLKIGVDNSFELMMDTQIFTYCALNGNAKIFPTYLPEVDLFDLLFKDSIQAAITGRPLNEKELEYFKGQNKLPESILFAWDAVALVVHPSNKDTTLTIAQVRDIFQGNISSWKEINDPTRRDGINVVFDNNKSTNARFIREKLLEGKEFPANCFAVQTNEEVINYVSENSSAMGVISLNWISDNADKNAQKFLEKIKVVGIVDTTNLHKPNMPRKPYQAYVFDKSYPLTREVYYIRTGLSASLGTGFVNHLLTDKGQLIIDRIGMVPKTPTERIFKITE